MNLSPEVVTKSDDHLALFLLVVRVGRADAGERRQRRETRARARVREYMCTSILTTLATRGK
jgi:hypothetical protein